jgi:cation diffusion facilitator family transporter
MKEARFVIYIGLLANLLLVGLKGLGGLFFGSTALVADATNSAADLVSGAVMLWGIRLSHRPPDKEHPYGHGKAETIAATLVAVLIALVGVEIGKNAYETIFFTVQKAPDGPAFFVAFCAVVLKEVLYRFTYAVGKRQQNQLILVSAWDHRADVLATGTALMGIALSLAGNYFNLPALYYFDPVAGLLVSIYVLWMAFKLARESINRTLDCVLDESKLAAFYRVLQGIEGLQAVHEVKARQHGPYLFLDLKLAVDARYSVAAGHQVGKEAKRKLIAYFPEIVDVLVHINPAELKCRSY